LLNYIDLELNLDGGTGLIVKAWKWSIIPKDFI
jgi:hypothetical protein